MNAEDCRSLAAAKRWPEFLKELAARQLVQPIDFSALKNHKIRLRAKEVGIAHQKSSPIKGH